jgi:hypothetical protein
LHGEFGIWILPAKAIDLFKEGISFRIFASNTARRGQIKVDTTVSGTDNPMYCFRLLPLRFGFPKYSAKKIEQEVI